MDKKTEKLYTKAAKDLWDKVQTHDQHERHPGTRSRSSLGDLKTKKSR